MGRWVHGSHALLDQDQWQLLVEVLDGEYDWRKLEDAQDVLTRAAPSAWLEEAEAAEEARRAVGEQQDNGEVAR